jgi:hypothetical protein
VSAKQSDLTAPGYGYDFVLAVTQASVNTTMKEFIANTPPTTITGCYVGDPANPKTIGYQDLLKLANGSDPFAISPTADPANDKNLANLRAAGFVRGFQAQIGLPPFTAKKLAQMPDVVTLLSPQAAGYNLLCSTFTLAQLSPTGAPPTWARPSQQKDAPWVVGVSADLRLSPTAPDAFSTLPAAVQQQIKDMGDDLFSVQRLLLDLASLAGGTPVLSGTAASDQQVHDLLATMAADFAAAYCGAVAKNGGPVLGVMITQETGATAGLTLTDVDLQVQPYRASDAQKPQDLATLDYLCAADNHTLPAPAPFSWDWVDAGQLADCHGATAVNRAAVTALVKGPLLAAARQSCYKPSVKVTATYSALNPKYDVNAEPGQEPTVSEEVYRHDLGGWFNNGATRPTNFVLHLSYNAEANDSAGLSGWIGKASMKVAYSATAGFCADTITVSQSLRIDLSYTHLASTTSGTPVSCVRIDQCHFLVDDTGALQVTMDPPQVNNSATENDIAWYEDMWTGLNERYQNAASFVQSLVAVDLAAVDFSRLGQFVFPGGKTFSYKSVGFSDDGDLTSLITYADPLQVLAAEPRANRVTSGDSLSAGQWLGNDSYVVSANGRYAAYLQDDANFVLCAANSGYPDLSKPYWSAAGNRPDGFIGPRTGPPFFAVLLADGDVRLCNGNGDTGFGVDYWTSRSGRADISECVAVMQDDANFVVYQGTPGHLGAPIWATGTSR